MFVLLGMMLILVSCVVIAYYTIQMKKRNVTEVYDIENLKKRIDELDEDNVETTDESETAKIIVPDIVDSNESTIKSTQKEECKEYEVGPKQKIEKTVIGTYKKDEVFVNNEIERVEDEEPIKENKGLIGKILKN